jgi:hypothetical protein
MFYSSKGNSVCEGFADLARLGKIVNKICKGASRIRGVHQAIAREILDAAPRDTQQPGVFAPE